MRVRVRRWWQEQGDDNNNCKAIDNEQLQGYDDNSKVTTITITRLSQVVARYDR